MVSFYLRDPASSIWRGPFDRAAIQRAVAEGKVEPPRQVWSGRSTDAPIAASSIPANDGASDWLKALDVGLGFGALLLGGAWLLGEALKPKKAARSRSPRLPRPYSQPPEDPETVAIRRMAKRHVKNGAEVRADIPGWPRPPKINGYIPDVHAVYPDGREVVLEFENRRSVFSTHARRQDAAFSTHACEFEHVEYEQVVVRGGQGGRR